MTDFKASIKIKMEFMGVKDKCDMYINYNINGSCNVDERVIEFFENVYERGMEKYNKMIIYQERERNKEKIESEEKEELKRLKGKYEK